MHKDSFNKIHFKLDNQLTTKIRCIDKQKDESLRWHISKIKKLRNKKWKSLKGLPPPSEKPMTSPSEDNVTTDVKISLATSFYAWDDTDSFQKSIITSTKLPAEMVCSNERISFTEVTKFYDEGPEENFNSLLRSYPQKKRDNVEDMRKKVKHIYIPHVNKEGRVIREDAFQSMQESDSISDDSLIEEEFRTNIKEFKERMEKKIANLRKIPPVPSFPVPVTSNKQLSILNMVRKIDLKKFEFSKARSRSNCRLSQALQESEKCRPLFTKNTKIRDETPLLPLENYPEIPSEEFVTAKYFKLETNDRVQNRLRKEVIIEDGRRWDQNVFMTDIEHQYNVKSYSEVEI